MRITKISTIVFVIIFLISFNSCGNNESGKSAEMGGGVNINKVFSFLPETSNGLIIFDFDKAFKIKFFKDMINKGMKEDTKSMKEIINKLDIENNLKLVALSYYSNKDKSNFYGCFSIKYDRDLLIRAIKENKTDIQMEKYDNVEIYYNNSEKQAFAFFDTETILISNNNENIKKMIDTSKNKLKSIQANNKIMSYINEVKGKGLIYFSLLIPEKDRKPMNTGMLNIDLSKAEALVGYLNYNDSIFGGEFKLLCNDESANSQTSTSLNGLKGLGAMFGPEVSELLNKINISSTPNFVKIDFKISEELINKVKDKMKKKYSPETQKNNDKKLDPFEKN